MPLTAYPHAKSVVHPWNLAQPSTGLPQCVSGENIPPPPLLGRPVQGPKINICNGAYHLDVTGVRVYMSLCVCVCMCMCVCVCVFTRYRETRLDQWGGVANASGVDLICRVRHALGLDSR